MLALFKKRLKGRLIPSLSIKPDTICLKLLVIILLVSCQKTAAIDLPNCRSVAYVIDSINYKGKVVKTDTSISWPRVCDAELGRFLILDKTYQPICGRPNCYVRLVIWK